MEKLERKLPSGKEVIVRGVTALDDILAYQLISADVDKDNPLAAGIMHRTALVLLSLAVEDGEVCTPPGTMNDVHKRLASFKIGDWREVERAYAELNEPQEVTPGE